MIVFQTIVNFHWVASGYQPSLVKVASGYQPSLVKVVSGYQPSLVKVGQE